MKVVYTSSDHYIISLGLFQTFYIANSFPQYCFCGLQVKSHLNEKILNNVYS